MGDEVHTRYMHGAASYGVSGPQTLHFGLGDAQVIDQLVLRWINGEVTILENVAVNQQIFIDAPGPVNPMDLTGDDRVDGADLTMLLGMWGTCVDIDDCQPAFNDDGQIDGADLTALLGAWTLDP